MWEAEKMIIIDKYFSFLIVISGILYGNPAKAKFFDQLNLMLRTELLSQTESDFLKNINRVCSPMKKKQDNSYYDKNHKQSPKSTQSRMCATVIDQYDPLINIYSTNMRSCSKFKEPVKSCCEAFDQGFHDPETSYVASKLCDDVPSHFKLMNEVKRKRLAKNKKYRSKNRPLLTNQIGGPWWLISSWLPIPITNEMQPMGFGMENLLIHDNAAGE